MEPIADNPDDVAFWQGVADFAYMLDGETAAFRRDAIERFLANTPKPNPRGPLEEYRRYALRLLLEIWLDGPMETEEPVAKALRDNAPPWV